MCTSPSHARRPTDCRSIPYSLPSPQKPSSLAGEDGMVPGGMRRRGDSAAKVQAGHMKDTWRIPIKECCMRVEVGHMIGRPACQILGGWESKGFTSAGHALPQQAQQGAIRSELGLPLTFAKVWLRLSLHHQAYSVAYNSCSGLPCGPACNPAFCDTAHIGGELLL